MGIGKWNAERVVDTNSSGTVRKVRIHVEELLSSAEDDALKARADSPYTQNDFDTYMAGVVGDWWDDVPSAVREDLRASWAVDA